ncbi:hypothetical protein ACWEQ2_01265 [Streptomyces sp. NPDC004096]|uniref:hypothetical protein n=1 Tax=Streptomyces sp. NPDC004680 TaxID=3154287 RepID=UPI0033A1FC2B
MRSTSAATALAVLIRFGRAERGRGGIRPGRAGPARWTPRPGGTVNSTVCRARKCLYFTQ